MQETVDERLSREIERIGKAAGATSVALALHDYKTDEVLSYRGDEWFHAASTIKIPVLVGVFAAIHAGTISLDSRVHVRNRFVSVANGRAFRVDGSRDADASVHLQIGKTMRVRELARQMIVTSSNLATNLLVDLVGLDELQATLDRFEIAGVDLHRGVEDEAAYEAGISNRVTAMGLVSILRLIEEGALSREASRGMLDILHSQEFRSGIPAGLPSEARVANKTGEISTVAHDAGLVYLPNREPYSIAILTEWSPSVTSGRRDTLAAISRAAYRHLTDRVADA